MIRFDLGHQTLAHTDLDPHDETRPLTGPTVASKYLRSRIGLDWSELTQPHDFHWSGISISDLESRMLISMMPVVLIFRLMWSAKRC
ncbi:hypothetical protein ElyMa_004892800 [Elysia marginata]|uniref:Uncharacterized protein n=1 Tax=Elysia marginata TaxID=1093978 RepID=A0AAV4IUL3_9GAST|nr:hypothetical protein ElyMa_004892800 [Elysia marginata]